MISRLGLRLASVMPAPMRRLAYRVRPLRVMASRLLRMGGGEAVATIQDGPLRGTKLFVDEGTPRYYLFGGAYEAAVDAAFVKHLRPGDVAVDVGAHIGIDTLRLAGLVGREGMVISFEPDPANFARLQRNVILNDLHRVQIHAAAVGDRTGTAHFRADGLTTSSLTDDTDESAVEVSLTTLDDAFPASSAVRVALVKIDVEGAEAYVLRGAMQLLHRDRPVLVIEVHHQRALNDCLALLNELAYDAERLDADESHENGVPFERGHLLAVPRPIS